MLCLLWNANCDTECSGCRQASRSEPKRCPECRPDRSSDQAAQADLMTEGVNPSRLTPLWCLGLGELVNNRAESFTRAASNCLLPQHKSVPVIRCHAFHNWFGGKASYTYFGNNHRGCEGDCFRSRLDCSRTRSLETKVEVALLETPRTRTTAGNFLLPNSTVFAGNGERGGPRNSQTRRK
jgi:hypothetical protein